MVRQATLEVVFDNSSAQAGVGLAMQIVGRTVLHCRAVHFTLLLMLWSSHPICVECLQEVHDALWATPDVAIDYHKLIRNHDVKAGPWRNNQRTISFWTPLKAPAFVCKMIGEVQRCVPLWQVPCPGTSVPAEKISAAAMHL